MRVDHTVESEVEACSRALPASTGGSTSLVNSIAGEDPMLGGWGSFWKTDLSHGADALRQSLLSHLITAKHARR